MQKGLEQILAKKLQKVIECEVMDDDSIMSFFIPFRVPFRCDSTLSEEKINEWRKVAAHAMAKSVLE